MQFSTILFALAPLMAFALPAQKDNGVSAANTEDWKTALGWDGTVTQGNFLEKPKNEGEKQVEKRTAGGLYYCEAYGFVAPCAYVVFSKSGDCLILSNDYRYTISSVGPDAGTTCYLYWTQDCSGYSSASIYNPGGDLNGAYNGDSTYWNQWNDYTGSIKCTF